MLLLLYCVKDYTTPTTLCQHIFPLFFKEFPVFCGLVKRYHKSIFSAIFFVHSFENFTNDTTTTVPQKGNFMKKSEISIIGGLFLAIAVTFFADINMQADSIRGQTLRLHIIARDDSARSQLVKMQVKDVIANTAASMYCRAENFDEAVQITQDNLDYIQQVTDNTLKNLGEEYTSQCSIEQFYFDTTEYEDFTMPRGRYTALTIRLGDAQGRNWWCVVYPALCISAGGQYEDDDSNTFIETENFRLKFKAVELWQKFVKSVNCDESETYDKA